MRMKGESGNHKQWIGDMEADYIYTSGVAGDRFFKKLRDKGLLSATQCKKCDITYMPPRMYCEICFEELVDWKDLSPSGTIDTFTVASIDIKGKKLDKPEVWAFVKIEGSDGGLVHRIEEIDPTEIKTGMKVEAVLRPSTERTGEITDIAWFRPRK
jgi:uncharacterized OB-fold protein